MRTEQPGRFDDVRLTPPDILFDQKLTVAGGDLTLELFATPGHKADHIAVYIPEIRTLFAGDAAEQPFPFVESAVSFPNMRKSLDLMAALLPTTVFYCHAPVTSGPQLISLNINYFDTIEDRCRTALKNGVSAQIDDSVDVEVLVGFPYEEAIPADMDAAELADFYRPGHRFAIQAMLEFLSNNESLSKL
jgi:glyoxylase-like metal-dependent hydrolase (beta-lactamase superfamily II)